jgi:hypothetical protein
MSDRPKPGKDKDLRFVRLALEETEKLFQLLSAGVEAQLQGHNGLAVDQADERPTAQLLATFSAEYSRFLTESLLLTLEQIDLLDQMLDDALQPATQLLEHNRTLRTMLRTTMTETASAMSPMTQLCAVRFLGQQQKLLLTLKGIRGRGIGDG